MEPKADHLTFEGALKLGKRIERYWKVKHGRTVTTRVEMFRRNTKGSGSNELYAVRSDMRNGAPR